MKTIAAQLKDAHPLTEDVYQFDFAYLDGPIDFKAGQFFMLQVPGEKTIMRSYSIASPPSEDGFSLCVKLIPGGMGSTYLKQLKPGDEVKFMAPFGHFFLREADADIIMVATGTGLAPFMSMLPVLFEQGFERSITLYFGVREEADLFYMEKLDQWTKEHPHFHFVPTLSRPGESWGGVRGRVTEHLELMNVNPKETHIYICGNGPMVKDVRAIAQAKDLPKEAIHLEQFTTL